MGETFGPWLTTGPAELLDDLAEFSPMHNIDSGKPGSPCYAHCRGCEFDRLMDRIRRVYPTGTAQGPTPEATCSSPFHRWEGWLRGGSINEYQIGVSRMSGVVVDVFHRDGEYAMVDASEICLCVLSGGRMWTGEEG